MKAEKKWVGGAERTLLLPYGEERYDGEAKALSRYRQGR